MNYLGVPMRLLTSIFISTLLAACSVGSDSDAPTSSTKGDATPTEEANAAPARFNQHIIARSTPIRFGAEKAEVVELYSNGSVFHNSKMLATVRQYRQTPGITVLKLPAAFSANDHQFAKVFLATVAAGAADRHLECLYSAGFTNPAVLGDLRALSLQLKGCGVDVAKFTQHVQSSENEADAIKARAFVRELNPPSVPGVLVKGKTYVTLGAPEGLDQAVSMALSN